MRFASLSVAALGLLLVMAGSGAQVYADGNTSGPPGPDGTVSVTLGMTYNDNAFYSLSLGAIPDSASINIYAVTGPATVAITVTDCCQVGDYFELWQSSSASFAVATPVGTTPQVKTDASIVAPTYNPFWDGSGSTLSTGTFIVFVPSGTTYFAVQDKVQDALGALLDGPCAKTTLQLVSSGCSTLGISLLPDYLLAGFTIGFAASSPQGAPQFGSPSFVVAALALPLLLLLRRMTTAGVRNYE